LISCIIGIEDLGSESGNGSQDSDVHDEAPYLNLDRPSHICKLLMTQETSDRHNLVNPQIFVCSEQRGAIAHIQIIFGG